MQPDVHGVVTRPEPPVFYDVADRYVSELRSDFAQIAKRCGPFDVALLPIGAYEPRWFMRYLHMNPEEAVTACRELGARVMVPIHWGTFELADEAMDEPPLRARAAWEAAGLAADRYRQLAHGETTTF